MENTNTRSANRFAFPSYGWVALLMLASALMGGAAGHAFAAQPAVAAPAKAPLLTQAELAGSKLAPNVVVSNGTGESDLRQEMRDMRLAQSLRSRDTESQPISSAAAGDASSQNDLRWQMNALRQAHKSVQSATTISDAAPMTGTYQPGMQGLQLPGAAISVNSARMTGTYLPGMQGLQLSSGADSIASRDDLSWKMNALRQARLAVQPAADAGFVNPDTARAATVLERLHLMLEQSDPSAAPSNVTSQGDLSWKMNALRQARLAVQAATAISDDARMTGTYQPGMQGLRQTGTAISDDAQMSGTYEPGMQGLDESGIAVSANAANLSDRAQIEMPTANPYLSNDARHPVPFSSSPATEHNR